MARKIRSDCTVGTLEKKYGLPAGTIRNKDGRDTRSDKLVGTIRKEAERRLVIFTSHTEVYAEMLGAQILRVGKG